MHRFVYDYANEIAPDPVDPLHELLEDASPVPTVPLLMGRKYCLEKYSCLLLYFSKVENLLQIEFSFFQLVI